jgi:hypothetical protein
MEIRGGYDVHLWGMPEVGSPSHHGLLTAGLKQIHGWVNDLHEAWSKQVRWQDPASAPGATRHYPLADAVDLRQMVDPVRVESMWRDLASAGHQLFRNLFMTGDERLRKLGAEFAELLRQDDHVITIASNEIVVPWSMLYIPPVDPMSVLRGDAPVEPGAFVGYRHLVEHTFEKARDPRPDIQYDGSLSVSAYFDARLDRPPAHRKRRPIVEPVLDTVKKYAAVHQSTSKRAAFDRLTGAGVDDHLHYFCCHSRRSDSSNTVLQMSAEDSISAGDLEYWLTDGFRTNPFVMVNACQVGSMPSPSPADILVALLDQGACCALGPNVNIPATFASEFAGDLFSRVLSAPRRSFGEAVNDLVRHFVDVYGNPFGLSYSIFHGIDSHFCRTETTHAPTAS